jgi:hypothetical protein
MSVWYIRNPNENENRSKSGRARSGSMHHAFTMTEIDNFHHAPNEIEASGNKAID